MFKAILFFSILLFIGIDKLSAQDKSFEQTVQFIKNKVACCSVPYSKSTTRRVESIEINKAGDISIVYADNKRKQTFNILKLHKEKAGDTGIDIVMNGLFVQFYVNEEKIRHIRFATAADAKAVYNALLQLYKKLSATQAKSKPYNGKFFVSRNDSIHTSNQTMFESIRPVDKKDQGDSTISIESHGEGWLDEDSLPVGLWKFYANNTFGKEYLLKSGNYTRTHAAMFRVMNIDSVDLNNHYHLSPADLQQNHVNTIPFIKSGKWEYFHSNGKRWKSINYQTEQLPINTAIAIMDPENTGTSMLSVELKESPDEWINTEVTEYKEDGLLYKKIRYNNAGEVYQKTIYGKKGQILKTETARPYEAKLSAVND